MAGHAQALVQVCLKVVDHVDTAELREDLDENGKEQSLPVAWSPEDLAPSDAGDGLLESDLLTHLAELSTEEAVVMANVSVKSLNNGQGLIVALLLEQPTRRVWQEVDTDEDDDSRQTLEGERKAPLELAVCIGTGESDPLCSISL